MFQVLTLSQKYYTNPIPINKGYSLQSNWRSRTASIAERVRFLAVDGEAIRPIKLGKVT
jgi:hypothetical protein